MENEQQVRTLVLRVLNVAETGHPDGKPHAVYVYADGKNSRKQVTLGVGFTEDGGNLEKVLRRYIAKKGALADQLSTHLSRIGKGTLAADKTFHQVLKLAGERDPLMAEAQAEEFSKAYLEPAFNWFTRNGFTLPLSFLVIADSYLHSGQIRQALRNKFPEVPPIKGGNEKAWVRSYVEVRHSWLANHSNKILRNTVYRTQCFQNEIDRENWMLNRLPIHMHGVAVHLPARPSTNA
jgi:chitosanase